MIALMSEHKFRRLVKELGYYIAATQSNEWLVLDSQGAVVSGFAVRHGRGKRREVKAAYIKALLKAHASK